MATLKVDGMTCMHCAKGVKAALEAVPGVLSAEVDLKAGQAEVRGTATPEALVAAVVEEGYEARVL